MNEDDFLANAMTPAKDSRFNPDLWLFRKSFDLRLSNSAEKCARKIRNLDGGKLGNLRVGVRIVDTNESTQPFQFVVRTRYGRITGGLKGELRDEQGNTILLGFAGITADVLFLFGISIVGAPLIFFSVSEQDFAALVYSCLFSGLLVAVIYAGCITTRNALIRRITDLLLQAP